mmetsp:Transcript_5600/g.12773  ORF Transcript_5600/g.12773 Transcript_5600/m.12773 type:complete len:248 (+) Transcript_5600:2100-2843(+)
MARVPADGRGAGEADSARVGEGCGHCLASRGSRARVRTKDDRKGQCQGQTPMLLVLGSCGMGCRPRAVSHVASAQDCGSAPPPSASRRCGLVTLARACSREKGHARWRGRGPACGQDSAPHGRPRPRLLAGLRARAGVPVQASRHLPAQACHEQAQTRNLGLECPHSTHAASRHRESRRCTQARVPALVLDLPDLVSSFQGLLRHQFSRMEAGVRAGRGGAALVALEGQETAAGQSPCWTRCPPSSA